MPNEKLNEIGIGIWTFDGPEVVFAGARMHTRMTVVRLADQSLWVHSPVALSSTVREVLAELGGEVAALVAPNKFHHLFVGEWRTAFPHARVFAETELQRKVPELGSAESLTNTAPALYAEEIEQVVFAGNRLFREVVFLHKPSRTLILTDLFANLKLDRIAFLPGLFLRFEGIVFPTGGIPRTFRWFTRDRAAAQSALAVISDWAPEQVTFCHGEPFTEAVSTVLEREFAWLQN